MSQIIDGTREELVVFLNHQPNDRYRLIKLPVDSQFMTFEEAFTKATNRSPEEIEAARERVLKSSPKPRDLPEGKTLEEVVSGKWPGDETDEQIFAALEKLS